MYVGKNRDRWISGRASTTWRRPRATLGAAAPPDGTAAAKRRPIRDHRKPLQLTVTWRPGAEPWIDVKASDGRVWTMPGALPIFEVILRVCGWE